VNDSSDFARIPFEPEANFDPSAMSMIHNSSDFTFTLMLGSPIVSCCSPRLSRSRALPGKAVGLSLQPLCIGDKFLEQAMKWHRCG
jgi:hypothetical protein